MASTAWLSMQVLTTTPNLLPGGRLLAYGMATQPDLTKSPTVVCSSYLVNGHPHRPAARAVERLAEAGVRAVVVGHQPHGDAPVVIRCPIRKAQAAEESAGQSAVKFAEESAGKSAEEAADEDADSSFSSSVEWV